MIDCPVNLIFSATGSGSEENGDWDEEELRVSRDLFCGRCYVLTVNINMNMGKMLYCNGTNKLSGKVETVEEVGGLWGMDWRVEVQNEGKSVVVLVASSWLKLS